MSRAAAIAGDLEHITPPDLADRLAHLLGDPTTGPQGRPIPTPGHPAPGRTMALAELPVGKAGTVVHLVGADRIMRPRTAKILPPFRITEIIVCSRVNQYVCAKCPESETQGVRMPVPRKGFHPQRSAIKYHADTVR